MTVPKVQNQQSVIAPIPPRKAPNLLRQSLENGVSSQSAQSAAINRFVTPYKHDPHVMNADLPLPPVTFRRSNNFNSRRTYPSIDEAEEFLLENQENQPQQILTNNNVKPSSRQVQFLTPRRQHNHHRNEFEYCSHQRHFDEDRVRNRPEPKDR